MLNKLTCLLGTPSYKYTGIQEEEKREVGPLEQGAKDVGR
jgi:hypothetical protein